MVALSVSMGLSLKVSTQYFLKAVVLDMGSLIICPLYSRTFKNKTLRKEAHFLKILASLEKDVLERFLSLDIGAECLTDCLNLAIWLSKELFLACSKCKEKAFGSHKEILPLTTQTKSFKSLLLARS